MIHWLGMLTGLAFLVLGLLDTLLIFLSTESVVSNSPATASIPPQAIMEVDEYETGLFGTIYMLLLWTSGWVIRVILTGNKPFFPWMKSKDEQ
jgi:hypothetical protein